MQVIVAASLALVIATVLIGYGFSNGINLYRSPSQVMTDPPRPGEVFRLGGLVSEGTLVRGQGSQVSFTVTDTAQTVPVTFVGILPDLFGEGEGMIGTGSMVGNTFVATEILAKHDENYMPREVVDSLKAQGVYVDPKAPPASPAKPSS